MSNRIAITGMGLVCHQADTPEELWRRVRDGIAGKEFTAFPTQSSRRVPALAAQSDLDAEIRSLRVRRMRSADRTLRLAVCAAARAWKDAGLRMPAGSATTEFSEAAVVVGSSRGLLEKMFTLGQNAGVLPGPRLSSDSATAALHGTLASAFAAHGPAFTVSTACASGAHAIALAADQIRLDRTPIALAGGADAPLHPLLMQAMDRTGILDSGEVRPVCRPFSVDRAGTVLGEGAAFLILEAEDHAMGRGATIHGFLAGVGMAADGRISSPESAGEEALELAAMRALADAGISAGQIHYINAHGTGTLLNDALETRWLEKFNRQRDEPVMFGSTKPVTGHCLGATPVLEVIVCLLAMRHRLVPPSANCTTPMPEALPGLVCKGLMTWDGSYAMSNSIGFWGSAASLILAGPPGGAGRVGRISESCKL